MRHNMTFYLLFVMLTTVSCRISVPLWKLAACQEFVTDAMDCEHYFPIDILHNYRDEKHSVFIQLYVLSYRDAIFALSSNKSKADIRIVIGGWHNTQSVLRHHEIDVDKSNIKNIVSPMWPIPIDIRYTTCGWLDISIPGTVSPLFAMQIPDLKVNYLCLGAYGSENRWFYNCLDDDDYQHKNNTKSCNMYSDSQKLSQNVNDVRNSTNEI